MFLEFEISPFKMEKNFENVDRRYLLNCENGFWNVRLLFWNVRPLFLNVRPFFLECESGFFKMWYWFANFVTNFDFALSDTKFCESVIIDVFKCETGFLKCETGFLKSKIAFLKGETCFLWKKFLQVPLLALLHTSKGITHAS